MAIPAENTKRIALGAADAIWFALLRIEGLSHIDKEVGYRRGTEIISDALLAGLNRGEITLAQLQLLDKSDPDPVLLAEWAPTYGVLLKLGTETGMRR